MNEVEVEKLKTELAEAKKEQQIFLANISHEIRTPVNGILGMAELLLHQKLPPKHEKYVRTIYRSTETLLALINDLLDISALEKGDLKIAKVPCCLPEILQETALLLSNRALENGIALRLYCPPQVPYRILTDPIRLKEILFSLVENAIKFTGKGEVILGVIPDPLEFFVSDTGIGISEDLQGRIFERFVQNNAAKRKYAGAGLGLCITRSILERMGGKIGFKSKEGKGSLFHFTLPLEVIPSPPIFSDEARASLEGKRVLIISTNHVKQFYYSTTLRWAGLQTIPAQSLQEGHQILEQGRSSGNKLDAVLFCKEEQNEDWLEWILKIEREVRLHGAQLIFNEWLNWWAKQGMDEKPISCHFLPKPTLPSEVFKLLTDLLNEPKVKRDYERAL